MSRKLRSFLIDSCSCQQQMRAPIKHVSWQKEPLNSLGYTVVYCTSHYFHLVVCFHHLAFCVLESLRETCSQLGSRLTVSIKFSILTSDVLLIFSLALPEHEVCWQQLYIFWYHFRLHLSWYTVETNTKQTQKILCSLSLFHFFSLSPRLVCVSPLKGATSDGDRNSKLAATLRYSISPQTTQWRWPVGRLPVNWCSRLPLVRFTEWISLLHSLFFHCRCGEFEC